MKTLATLGLGLGALALAVPASAQEASTSDTETFQVIGTVPTLCSAGSVTTGTGVFDMGVLINTSTGLLRTDLAAPDKVLTGAFCSGRSTISISATPMAAQNFTGTPPAGYSTGVNYTATASGWTAAPAAFTTGAASNTGATQTRATAFSGDITVSVSNFATAGGTALRPVADPNYSGLVTVTLAGSN